MSRALALVVRALVAMGIGVIAASGVLAAADDPLAKHFGGPFELTSHENRTVRDTDFRGKFMLVSFGYTNCPDICPTILTDMTSALEMLGPEADKIQPIFITVDPARDTAAILADYRKSFDSRLMMLTGTEQQIAAVAKAYRVHRRKYLFPKQANPGPNEYGVDHGSLVYLMGPDGKFLTFIPYGTPPEKMAATLKRYVDGAVPSH